ncbi:MAG TPA: GNAT family N-acetyltransferase [Candidatus Limnocylindrales bacterium]|nr:GNAT family N-acetyltransferase [Candidatus Limnocylindrales bacterium]
MTTRASAMSAVELEIEGAPAIDGLRFRRPTGSDDDYEAMAGVVNAANIEDVVPWLPTGTNLREEMQGSSGLDPLTDVVLGEVDGMVVAVASVERTSRGGQPMYDVHGHIAPEHRRRGLGRPLLAENLRRAREIAYAHDDPYPLTIRGWTGERETGHQSLLTSEGFTTDRWFFLMRRPTLDDIPEVPLPEGIQLRPVRPADHRAIFDAEFEAFQDHWLPDDYDEAQFEELFKKTDLDTGLWVVAWDGDEIAGVIQNWIWTEENERLGVKRGWLEKISVRRPWRRRGLARAMTAESLRRFRTTGMTDAMLGVDTENGTGALRLYEELGFEVDQRTSAFTRTLER